VQVSAAVFRTTSQDDIVFLRSGVSQAGFFANVDRTRRQGFELSAQGRSARLEWLANYSFLDATYRSDIVLPGPLSTEAQPNAVTRGARIAGMPRHLLKFAVDWRAAPGLTLGADWQAVASQVVAGNESGRRPELGRLPGYSVVHARASWQVTEQLQLYLRVHNVFDRRFATFAAGNLDFFPQGAVLQPGAAAEPARFVAPAAPRMGVIGLRYEWGR
jgi:outer membrane receptor protein involved in Fe transport